MPRHVFLQAWSLALLLVVAPGVARSAPPALMDRDLQVKYWAEDPELASDEGRTVLPVESFQFAATLLDCVASDDGGSKRCGAVGGPQVSFRAILVEEQPFPDAHVRRVVELEIRLGSKRLHFKEPKFLSPDRYPFPGVLYWVRDRDLLVIGGMSGGGEGSESFLFFDQRGFRGQATTCGYPGVFCALGALPLPTKARRAKFVTVAASFRPSGPGPTDIIVTRVDPKPLIAERIAVDRPSHRWNAWPMTCGEWTGPDESERQCTVPDAPVLRLKRALLEAKLDVETESIDGRPAVGFQERKRGPAQYLSKIEVQEGKQTSGVPAERFVYLQDLPMQAWWVPDERRVVLEFSGGDYPRRHRAFVVFGAKGLESILTNNCDAVLCSHDKPFFSTAADPTERVIVEVRPAVRKDD